MDTMSMSAGEDLIQAPARLFQTEMAKLVHDSYTGKFETDHLTPTVPVHGGDFILESFSASDQCF